MHVIDAACRVWKELHIEISAGDRNFQGAYTVMRLFGRGFFKSRVRTFRGITFKLIPQRTRPGGLPDFVSFVDNDSLL